MKIKTSELTGAALNWAVAKCEGNPNGVMGAFVNCPSVSADYAPSTDWAQGGPIIEREGINLIRCFGDPCGPLAWGAEIGYQSAETSTEHQRHDPMFQFFLDEQVYGPTPLIAGMRCYVASKLGDEIEVPDELMEAAG